MTEATGTRVAPKEVHKTILRSLFHSHTNDHAHNMNLFCERKEKLHAILGFACAIIVHGRLCVQLGYSELAHA